MRLKALSFIAIVGLFVLQSTAYATSSSTTNTADVGIQPGSISVNYTGATVSLGNVSVDGTTKTVTANLSNVQVADNTGYGNGWTLTLQASQFAEVGGSAGLSLPLGSLTYKGVSSVDNGVTSFVSTDQVIDNGAPVTVATAASGQGIGNTVITSNQPSLSLLVDTSKAYVDTNNLVGGATPYSSTLTWVVSTGP